MSIGDITRPGRHLIVRDEIVDTEILNGQNVLSNNTEFRQCNLKKIATKPRYYSDNNKSYH